MEENKDLVRPTKKQRELLEYLEKFIIEHGYGPSYREIMNGCNYTSVATVAVHINNLINKGHLRKNGRSARSLEIVNPTTSSKPKLQTNATSPLEEKWLIDRIDYFFKQIEDSPSVSEVQFSEMQTLINALKVLGFESASLAFLVRIKKLKQRIIE